MNSNLSKCTYSITLPVTTSEDVIDWFEYMDDNKYLTEKLIDLVRNDIKSSNFRKEEVYNKSSIDETVRIEDKKMALQNDFINNLYN